MAFDVGVADLVPVVQGEEDAAPEPSRARPAPRSDRLEQGRAVAPDLVGREEVLRGKRPTDLLSRARDRLAAEPKRVGRHPGGRPAFSSTSTRIGTCPECERRTNPGPARASPESGRSSGSRRPGHEAPSNRGDRGALGVGVGPGSFPSPDDRPSAGRDRPPSGSANTSSSIWRIPCSQSCTGSGRCVIRAPRPGCFPEAAAIDAIMRGPRCGTNCACR